MRAPGFALAVLATFALGIGVNTAVFSAAWSLVLAPLPLAHSERLVAVWGTFEGNQRRELAPANFLDWRREAQSFQAAAAYFQSSRALDTDGGPKRIEVASVSSQYFDVLGASPVAGRFFHGGEQGRLVVVAEPFWKSELGGGALHDRTIRLDGTSYDVVGVAPASFDLPQGAVAWTVADRDIPGLPLDVIADWPTLRDARYLGAFARLAPGATVASADAELHEIGRRLEAAYPDDNKGCGLRAVALGEDLGRSTASPLALLAAGAFAILLITCANVAGLALARGLGRRRELAVRAALGAGHGSLVRRPLLEMLLLALAGGALGVTLAASGAPHLVAWLPGAEIAGRSIGVTMTVALFAALLTLASALAAALTPALATLRIAPAEALAIGSRGAAGAGKGRLRAALVVAQSALAVLLVGSSLLIGHTLVRMIRVDPGFDARHVTSLRLWPPSHLTPTARAEVLGRAVEAAAAAPGVESSGAVLKLPLTGTGFSAGLHVEGRELPPGEQPDVVWRLVAGNYFRTLSIPLRSGRVFEPADAGSSDLVAIVNETLERQLWPGESALGRRIRTGLDSLDGWVRIVGVVGDTRQAGVTEPVHPEMYRPLAQPNRSGDTTLALVVRTGAGFSAASLRRSLTEVASGLVIEDAEPLSELVRRSTGRERLLGALLGVFGALALTLAGLGLYGVLALLVAERRREMGIRLAVGATAGNLQLLVVRQGLLYAALGLAVGLPASLALAKLFRSWLWQVSPADPWSFGGAVAALALVATLAVWIPARRAARTDPAIVLRDE